MTDVFDQASEREQLERDLAISSARKQVSAINSTGRCLWCNAEISGGHRWCDAECREDWDMVQEAGRRHRGRR